jgi:hypothetical protein
MMHSEGFVIVLQMNMRLTTHAFYCLSKMPGYLGVDPNTPPFLITPPLEVIQTSREVEWVGKFTGATIIIFKSTIMTSMNCNGMEIEWVI